MFNLLLPADPDEFLNHLDADPSAEVADPYWAALWPAAATTARLVLAHDWPRGTAALELGCGCGLVGLAGLAAGLDVTFSDLVVTAVQLAVENAHRNGWTAAGGLPIDWFAPPRRKYPLILGSDLLYETGQHDALLDTIDQLLAGYGHCWLGDPGRSAAESFARKAANRGYRLRILGADGQPAETLRVGQFRLLTLTPAACLPEPIESTGEGERNRLRVRDSGARPFGMTNP
jgi:predicted nicotinamide N-methyase